MVTYCCCVHAAFPAAYSMLLCNENVFVFNVVLYCYNINYNMIYYGHNNLHSFKLLLFPRVD